MLGLLLRDKSFFDNSYHARNIYKGESVARNRCSRLGTGDTAKKAASRPQMRLLPIQNLHLLLARSPISESMLTVTIFLVIL